MRPQTHGRPGAAEQRGVGAPGDDRLLRVLAHLAAQAFVGLVTVGERARQLGSVARDQAARECALRAKTFELAKRDAEKRGVDVDGVGDRPARVGCAQRVAHVEHVTKKLQRTQEDAEDETFRAAASSSRSPSQPRGCAGAVDRGRVGRLIRAAALRARACGRRGAVDTSRPCARSSRAYLKNGGTLERAARMANHASTRTTQALRPTRRGGHARRSGEDTC